MNHLRYEAKPGTGVEVQSNEHPDRFFEGYVGEEERVRHVSNGALLNAENYSVVRELDEDPDISHSMGLGDEADA